MGRYVEWSMCLASQCMTLSSFYSPSDDAGYTTDANRCVQHPVIGTNIRPRGENRDKRESQGNGESGPNR
jgi:hypothetical protein